MRLRPVAATCLFLLTVACATAAPRGAGAAPEPGQAFTLRPGASASIPRLGVSVGFEAVTADSRCPRDVQCIQAGEATVRLWVAAADRVREPLVLKTTPGGSAGEGKGVQIRLESLAPVATASRPVRAGDYRVTLVVEKR